MTSCAVFVLRILAVPFRLAAYLARALVLAAKSDPAAWTVFWTLVAAVLASLMALKLVRTAGRRTDANRCRTIAERRRAEADEFARIIRRSWPDESVDFELPETVRIRPHAAPLPPSRPVRRRQMPGVRIPGRRVRRTTASSSSDRRPR